MKRYTEPLAQIIKLHGPVEGRDANDKVIAICELCGREAAKETGEGAFRFPCPTYKVAHKALNPHISIAEVAKDALQKVKSTGGWDKDAPKVGAAT